jgi:hypothetical protein
MVKVLRNSDVKRIIAFIPPGHKHVRLYVEFDNEKYVLQEATIDAILRAYINIITHPTRKATELVVTHIKEKKQGYADYQHLETSRSEEEIISEINEILKGII